MKREFRFHPDRKYTILTDIDGTIRRFDGIIPDSTRETIKALRAAGHRVLICSGRPEPEIEPNIMELGFDGVISAGGARITLDGKCIEDITIPREKLLALGYDLTGRGVVCGFQSHRADYVLRDQEAGYRDISDRTQLLLPPGADRLLLLPQPVDSLEELEDIEKLMFLSDTVPHEEVIRDWGSQFRFLPVSFPSPVPYGGEITSLSVNKGHAVETLISACGLDRDTVIGVGDGDNDIELMQASGFGIAMGNGTDGAREAADLVAGRIENDGFANALRKLLFY